MNIKSNIFKLSIILFTILACSKEEIPVNIPEGEPIISAKIGDEPWEALDYESALNVIPGRGQFFELNSFNNKYQIDLSVLEFDKSTGTISQGTYEENFFFSLFVLNEEGNFMVEYKPLETGEDVEDPFRINITASTSSKISGTFSGKLQRVPPDGKEDHPEIIIITDGIFNNLPFETNTVNIQ